MVVAVDERVEVGAPPYELFANPPRRGRNHGWTREFIASLVEGVPARVPSHASKSRNDAQSVMGMAKLLGVPLATRAFGSEMWACRLRAEDART